jgi:uncharacterized protein with PIN domain
MKKKRCPICNSSLIKYDEIQYETIDPKRCIITGIKKILFCPNHTNYVIEG